MKSNALIHNPTGKETVTVNKRKTVLIFTLCLLLLVTALPGYARAADEVCFISVNDTLLQLSSSAYTTGGVTYVPYTVFNNFEINTTYFSSSATAMLYADGRQIFMDINQGYSFDAAGNRYNAQAMLHNGVVYVPVGFVCNYFGLTWSYVSGRGYGDLCRIKDNSVQLTDSQFFSAATSLMQARYNAYMGLTGPDSNPDNSADVTNPSPDPSLEDHSDTSVWLSFEGMPSDAVLESLSAWSVHACFFVTAAQVAQSPDTVRRIVAQGHTIGVLCSAASPIDDYYNTTQMLLDAACIRTVLVGSSAADADAVSAAAQENGLVFWGFDVDGVQNGEGIYYTGSILSALDRAHTRADLRLLCNDQLAQILPTLLQHLHDCNFVMCVPNEINPS